MGQKREALILLKDKRYKMGKFKMLCNLLPEDVNWGDPITPEIIEQAYIAGREAERYNALLSNMKQYAACELGDEL